MILIFAPIKRLAEINVVLQRGIAASESIFNLLDSKSEEEVTDSSKQQSFKEDFSNINFNDISFSYYNNDNQVLKNINFKVPRGSNCAIVGKSGSGKSTLINLLPRFYDITNGSLTIDEININSIPLKELRSMIALSLIHISEPTRPY